VRTIRYWSDVGLVPPAGRSASGRRLYDAGCLARLELAATLRELGLGLNEAQRVMANKAALAEVAAMHVEALDVRIRTLRLRRAVLAMVARRAADNEEMTLMNKLARLSAAERTALIDDFVAEVFDGVPAQPGLAAHMRMAPDLPDDPTPEQVDAWVELAELVQDRAFRQRIRQMAESGVAPDSAEGARPPSPSDIKGATGLVLTSRARPRGPARPPGTG
jgi:DNA-binding transcriptional MerR regulator